MKAFPTRRQAFSAITIFFTALFFVSTPLLSQNITSPNRNVFHAHTVADSAAFTDIQAQLTGAYYGNAEWGDYDNDGDLDVILSGQDALDQTLAKIYNHDQGNFTEASAALIPVTESAAAWGDYDNDGDLDLLLSGLGPFPMGQITKLYRNDNGAFVDTETQLTGVRYGALAWGDYDNDGDLDALVTGEESNNSRIAKLYRNDKGGFLEVVTNLTGATGAAAWGDYDNDGDLDLLLTGFHENGVYVGKVYRNDNAAFTDIAAPLLQAALGEAAWGDYDNDGDLDILLTGLTPELNTIAQVYRNDGGAFVDIAATLTPVEGHSSAAWGDYDNDGDLDILLSGFNSGAVFTKISRNDDTSFVEIKTALTGAFLGSASWGDYDNDGDLDILLTGNSSVDPTPAPVAKIYRNDLGNPPTPPNAPRHLRHSIEQQNVTLAWSPPDQTGTPLKSLTYNFRLGTTPGGIDIVSPMAEATSGYRRIAKLGNAQHDTSWTIKNLPFGTYYWSAQALAPNFAGSLFAAETSFTISPPSSLLLTPEALDFSAVNLSEYADAILTLTNTSAGDLNIFGLYLSGQDSADFAFISDTTFALPLGEQREITMRFQPQALGARSALFLVYHDGPEAFGYAYLSGEGVDTAPPIIANVNAVASTDLNTFVIISANVTDNYALQEARLLYRQGGQAVFLSKIKPGEFAAAYVDTIPATIAGARGIEFALAATDAVGNQSVSEARAVRVRLPDKFLSRTHSGGSAQNAYRLVSYPFESNDLLTSNTLVKDLGGAIDSTQWRLWDIDPSSPVTSGFPYREYPTVDNMAPGRAKFLITRELKILTSKPGVTVNTVEPFTIALRPGWNMIASPFNFDIPIANVQPESLRARLYAYNGDWQNAPGLLKPWEGYMIKTPEATTLTLHPSEAALQTPAALVKNTEALRWSLRLEAYCEHARDRNNFIGVAQEARVEWDAYERLEPPPIGEFVMLAFPRRKWQNLPDVYATDFRPPHAEGNVWAFEIATNISSKPVTLRVVDLNTVPPDLEVRLVDVGLQLVQDLRRDQDYVYLSGRMGQSKAFLLLIGKKAFVAEQAAALTVAPQRYELAQNFPNPFNPSTAIKYGLPQKARVTLQIYDLLGKEVATLLDNVEQSPGYHVAVWEGQDQQGRSLPSGIYLCRLQAGAAVLMKKMTVIK